MIKKELAIPPTQYLHDLNVNNRMSTLCFDILATSNFLYLHKIEVIYCVYRYLTAVDLDGIPSQIVFVISATFPCDLKAKVVFTPH